MSIEIKNLSYVYDPKAAFAARALDDVSFTIEDGDFFGIIGLIPKLCVQGAERIVYRRGRLFVDVGMHACRAETLGVVNNAAERIPGQGLILKAIVYRQIELGYRTFILVMQHIPARAQR